MQTFSGIRTATRTGLILGAVLSLGAVAAQAQQDATEDPPKAPAGVVNVNMATPEQLAMLPGIGPAIAARIVAARPLADLAGLDAVKGIGEKTLTALGPFVTFEGETTLSAKVKRPKVPAVLDETTGQPLKG